MGNDPPGRLTRLLHPRTGRHGPLPEGIIPIGRSVVVPANGSLPNIVLSPQTVGRVRRVLASEQFDLVHLHEPMTPAICVAALAFAQCPIVVTHHAHGDLAWMKPALHFWGFLMDRVDIRIAVSPMAAESAARWIPDDYRVIPNGVLIPEGADPADRDHTVVFIGRHDPRKGLPTLLRAWPRDPSGDRSAAAPHRHRPAPVPAAARAPPVRRGRHRRFRDRSERGPHHELERAKVSVTPALGGESFGLVLAEAFACATPAVASDIPGYAAVAIPEASRLVPPSDPDALADAVIDVLSDEPRRVEMGRAAREHALANYAWDDIARRLEETYFEAAA